MDYLLQKNNGNLKIPLKRDILIDTLHVPALLNYEKVSENHASLQFYNRSWYIEDIGSEYGIFVNNVRVGKNPRKLEYWDIIGLGGSFIDGAFVCVLCPASSGTGNQDVHTTKLYLSKKNKSECSVPLIKCDSEFFIWPSDVKIINFKPRKTCDASEINVEVPYTNSLVSEAVFSTENDKLLNYIGSSSKNISDFEIIENDVSFIKSCTYKSSNLKYPTDLSSICFQNDDSDAESKSSVESMDIIRYPSHFVLSQIDKSQDKSNYDFASDKKSEINQKKKQRKSSKKFIYFDDEKHTGEQFSSQKKKLISKAGKISKGKQSKEELVCTVSKRKKSAVKQSNASSKNSYEYFIKQCDSLTKDDQCMIKSYTKILQTSDRKQLFHQSSSNSVDKNDYVNADKCKTVKHPILASKKTSTVKRRSENYGSRMKYILSDMKSTPLKPKSKHTNPHSKKVNDSINSCQIDFQRKSQKKLIHTSQYRPERTNIIQPALHNSSQDELIATSCPTNEKSNFYDIEKISPNDKVYKTRKKTSNLQKHFCNSSQATQNVNLSRSTIYTSFPEESINISSLTNNFSMKSVNKNITNKAIMKSKIEISQNNLISTSHLDKIQINNNMKLLDDAKHYIKSVNQKFSNSTITNKSNANKDEKPFKGGTEYLTLIKRVVEMNTKWLNEIEECIDPPTDVAKGAENLPLKFDSYSSYSSSFFPMIMLEIWEDVCLQSKPIFENKNTNKFYFSVVSCIFKSGLIKLECESVVSEKVSFMPSKENLVILDLKQTNGISSSILGFITKHTIHSLNMNSLSTKEWRNLPLDWLYNAKRYQFDVYIKIRDTTILKHSLMKGNGICTLKDKFRLLDSLSYLESSPLLDDILIPSWNTFSVACSGTLVNFDYFSTQEIISEAVCNEIRLPKSEKKIMLLQGPPGSGKTSIIIRILHNLIYQNRLPMKILVSARSNYALDKIGNQLIKQNAESEWRNRPLNFVRIGHSQDMHPMLMPYAFTEKVKLCQRNSEEEYHRWECKLKSVQSEFFQRKAVKENYDEDLKRLEQKYFNIQTQVLNKKNQLNEIFHKSSVLSEAHVILSTLEECVQLYEFKNILNICCCIIDEINQATELEFLLPLKLEINKFFLIGDPMQLNATVKSQLAIKCGFQRSIFERFQLYFLSCKMNPLINLSEQFRMNTSIWRFPLQYFYNNIITSSEVNLKSCNFLLQPYTLLDDQSEFHNFNCTHNDHSGPSSIISVCACILELYHTNSIGVIVPFEKTKDRYASAVFNCFSHSNIEVDTVYSFQGREKEIIIISCFRDDIFDTQSFFTCCRQLNVALTRASCSLIICGPLCRLKVQTDWKNLISDAQARETYFSYSCTDNISVIFKSHMLKKM